MEIFDALVCDTASEPFHLPGIQIYWEPDGVLSYECPHCGRREVPRLLVKELAPYAEEAPSTDR